MAIPVRLPEGNTGMTRDISASGIYFEADCEPPGNMPLAFSVEFRNDNGAGMTLRCKGEVLRVERLGNRVGVAARILESRLEPNRAPAIREPVRSLVISDGFADSFQTRAIARGDCTGLLALLAEPLVKRGMHGLR